ncbi:MAG: hypothetical protein IT317_24620 [Anaerolineales bacterium]|nr:hypothetical protein [Anaerolineales bacterium]
MAEPAWQSTPVATPQYVPTAVATAVPSSTATPEPPPPIVENIFHIIRFPFATMMDAVVQMSNKIMLQSYREAGQRFTGALDALVTGPYGLAPDVAAGAPTPLFENLVLPHWRVTLTAAFLLLPLTLMLTAVSALRLGATSALGLADLKEALIGWLISAGAAGSSYYLLGLAHRLSVATAGSLLAADFGTRVTGATLAGAFFNVTALLALAGNLLTSPIVLYLAFFGLFLASSVMLGLGLALAAYTALVYLLTALAPVVLVLGTLPPLRWLQALWLKSVVVIFLIPVVDALLLKAAVSLFYDLLSAQGSGDVGTFIAGVFITAGVVSVLIAINFKVGESVFGALAEVHRQAFDATMGMVKLAAVAVGFAAGGLAIGAGAGAMAGAGGAGEAGAAVAAGGPPIAGGPGGAVGGASVADIGNGGARASSTAQTGSALAHSNSGLGSGGIARRMAQLLTGSPGETSAMQTNAGSNDQPATIDQAQGASVSDEGHGAPQTDTPAGAVGPSGSEVTGGMPAPQTSGSDAQLRRARLAGSFGRALAHSTRNPVIQGLGLGLQARELAGALQAEQPQSTTGNGGSDENGISPASMTGALRWSNRDLSHLPNDLFDPGRDNTELMAGGLHQAFVSSGRATRIQDMVGVAQESYGAWRQQGQPGGLAAQRELFEAMLDPNTKASPEALVSNLESLASRHGFQLDGNIAATARLAFARSQDSGAGDVPSPSSQRRSE